MKQLMILVLPAGGFVALSTINASAVVCARGVCRAGVRWAARRGRRGSSCPARRSCCATSAGRCRSPQGVLIEEHRTGRALIHT